MFDYLCLHVPWSVPRWKPLTELMAYGASSSSLVFTFHFCLERNRCLVNPCRNGGVCSTDEKKPVCNCSKGFVAEFCQGIRAICRNTAASYFNVMRVFVDTPSTFVDSHENPLSQIFARWLLSIFIQPSGSLNKLFIKFFCFSFWQTMFVNQTLVFMVGCAMFWRKERLGSSTVLVQKISLVANAKVRWLFLMRP